MMILWLYARLLRLYPRGFYERFGAEMFGVFVQAWQDRPHGRRSALVFCLHEFGGLLISIVTEHGRAGGSSGLRVLLRKRFVPIWLLIFSLIVGVLFSLNYWGYLAVPSSTIAAVRTVDHIALVQFDANYTPSVIPLNDLPMLITPDFPPSQILSQLPANLKIDRTLDPTLAEHLAAALAQERVEIAGPHIAEYPREPVINPNGCGLNCFHPGVQPQPDGSFLVIFPEMTLEGQPTQPGMTQHVTPNDWWYYSFLVPAGYIVQGRAADGTPLIFVAIASGAVSNDHYRYHELTFTRGPDGLILRNRQSYNFDVAGIEGFTAPVIAAFLFVPLLWLWVLFLFVAALIRFVRRRVVGGRAVAR